MEPIDFPACEPYEVVLHNLNREYWNCEKDSYLWILFLASTTGGEEAKCVAEGFAPTKEEEDCAAVRAYIEWRKEMEMENDSITIGSTIRCPHCGSAENDLMGGHYANGSDIISFNVDAMTYTEDVGGLEESTCRNIGVAFRCCACGNRWGVSFVQDIAEEDGILFVLDEEEEGEGGGVQTTDRGVGGAKLRVEIRSYDGVCGTAPYRRSIEG